MPEVGKDGVAASEYDSVTRSVTMTPKPDPVASAASRRPWWWPLTAPFYIVAGLVKFLRHGSNA